MSDVMVRQIYVNYARAVQLRAAAGIEQKQFAERIGVTQQYYSSFEQGRFVYIPRSFISKVAAVFNLTGADFIHNRADVIASLIRELSDDEQHLLQSHLEFINNQDGE